MSSSDECKTKHQPTKEGHSNVRSKDSPSSSEAAHQMPQKQAISRCIQLLKRAQNDTEKFAALLMVTKVVKADSFEDKAKTKVLEAIGVNFIMKLLREKIEEESCPKFMFKSIALSILSSLVNSSLKREFLCSIVPYLLEVITNPQCNEENLTMVRDAYKCLLNIALTSHGRRAIIDDEGMSILVNLYVEENIMQDMIMEILKIMMNSEGQRAWNESKESFTKLATHSSTEFSRTQSEQKFVLCSLLTDIMFSMPDSVSEEHDCDWQKNLHQGLSDILLSKLSKRQREEGLKLGCACLSSLGIPWIISGGDKGRQLLMIMVHLSCIEVRMTLENESFEKAVELASHTSGCYNILERSIKFLVEGVLDLEDKQKHQLYTALRGAFNAILLFLKDLTAETVQSGNMQTQYFIYSTVRILGAWLAEETSANKPEVIEILPFIINICKYNYDWNKSNSNAIKMGKSDGLPDLLRFLLPGLCHLTAEDESRLSLLSLDIDKLLFEYMKSKFEEHKLICDSKNLSSGVYSSDGISLSDLNDTLVTLCSVFMNIVVTSSDELIMKNHYLLLLKFIISKQTELPSDDEKFLPLIGNLGVLGLLILRHQYVNIKSSQLGMYKFIQTVIRFLWDAHNIEDSPDCSSVVVSRQYLPIWEEVLELWYLGMHNLTALVSVIPWLGQFLLECDWPQSIVKTLKCARTGAMEGTLKSTFEEFLSALVEKSSDAKKALRECGAEYAARRHDMTSLLTVLHQ